LENVFQFFASIATPAGTEISQSSRLDFLQYVYHQYLARKNFLAAPAFL
jgi:hypothetical protein